MRLATSQKFLKLGDGCKRALTGSPSVRAKKGFKKSKGQNNTKNDATTSQVDRNMKRMILFKIL